MVDKLNPTNQFHPYQPAGATPHSEEMGSGGSVKDMLGKVGIDSEMIDSVTSKLKNVDMKQSLGKARTLAQSKPGLVLGGLAVAAIGAGLMRKRTS